jgi:hypothetical protein
MEMTKGRIDAIILLSVMYFLLSYFNISLLLLDTTMSSGDVASENYYTKYLRDGVISQGKLVNWSPGWYAGFPCLQFYFPAFFMITVALSYLLAYNIAFKIMTAAAVIAVPYACYLSLRQLGYKFPAPAMAASLSLLLLFTEKYRVMGGNISSMLAGMVSYAFGMVMLTLFVGTYPNGLKNGKMHVTNSILLSLCLLSSSFTALFAGLLMLAYVPSSRLRTTLANISYTAKVGVSGFLLSAWWTVPLIAKFRWAAVSSLAQNDTMETLAKYLPTQFSPIYAIGLYGLYQSIKGRDPRIRTLLTPLILAAILLVFLPEIPMLSNYTYNGRYISLVYLFSLLAAAPGFAMAAERLRSMDLAPIAVFLIVTYAIASDSQLTTMQIYDAYSGFEEKVAWKTFRQTMDAVTGLPVDARVMYEHSPRHNVFGTSRAFESVPYFSGKQGLEGTLFESSLSSVFVVSILQAEISKDPSCPLRGIKCPPMNMKDAAVHSGIYNVKYLILTSEKAQKSASADPDYRLVDAIPTYAIGTINIYELLNHDGKYVTVPANLPVVVSTKEWHPVSLKWFRNTSLSDVPLILTDDPEKTAGLGYRQVGENLTDIPRDRILRNCTINESIKDDYLEFDTSCIGAPHIVKVSYFPNWRASGALGPYLVSPSLMLVVPTQAHVTLRYENTAIDILGMLLTLMGTAVCLAAVLAGYPPLSRRLPKPVRAHIKTYGEKCRQLDRWGQLTASKASNRYHQMTLPLQDAWKRQRRLVIALAIGASGVLLLWGYAVNGRIIDDYRMGYAHRYDNPLHELICQSGCDESRQESVYTGWAEIKFKMGVKPMAENRITFTMNNNFDCRSMDVYINSHYVKTIKDNGKEQGIMDRWRDYSADISADLVPENRATVQLRRPDDECNGWDIKRVRVEA